MKKYIALFMTLVLLFTFSGCGTEDSITSDGSAVSPDTTDSSLTELQIVKAGSDDPVALATHRFPEGNLNVEKYGYINTQGQWVIAPQYAGGTAFSDGVAVVNTKEEPKRPLVIDKTGAVIAEFSEDIELAGMYVCGSSYDFFDGFNYGSERFISEGMFAITDDSGLYGYANTKGEVVVPPKYEIATDFSEGLAVVGYYENNKLYFSYIDTTGKTVIEGPFTEAHGFHEGLASVDWENSDNSLPDEESGYIDKSGNIVIRGSGRKDPAGYWIWEGPIGKGTDFCNGVAFTVYSVAGVTDDGYSNNKNVIATIDKSGNRIWTSDDREYSLASNTGTMVGDGMTFVSGITHDKGWIIIDQNGNIKPIGSYTPHYPFSDGLCIVSSAGSDQYMNHDGEIAITNKYAYAYSFSNGYACVIENTDDEYEYIDTSGNVAVTGDFINKGMPFTK